MGKKKNLDRRIIMREKTRKSLVCGWALLLVLFLLPVSAIGQTVIMFKSPYPAGKTMTVRDANASTEAVDGMAGWQSYTFSADPYGPGSREWFFQPGTDNECYDLDGMTTSDQNCGNKFSPALSWPTDTMWIIPDITTAKRVPILSEQRPRRVYFLNPEEWVTGVPEMVISGTAHRMLPDPDLCGWFYLDLFVEDGPFDATKNIFFRFDQDTTQVAGADGLSDIDVAFPYIDLESQFTLYGPKVYFEPLDFIWAGNDMELTGICGYNLAALIRDFHHSTHPNFYLPNDDPPYFNYSSFTGNDLTGTGYTYTGTPYPHSYSTGTKNPCEGITPGIIQNKLNTETRKPVYNPSSGCFGDPAGAADGTEWFDWLFKTDPNEVINQEHCYDLPFTKATDGLWVYDSQDEPDAGFFPMDWAALQGDAKAPFNIPAPAQCGAPLKTECVPFYDQLTPAQVAAGPAAIGCADGTTTDDWWYWGGRSCTMNGFWDGGYSGQDHELYAPRNQHFCFETHAEFIYSPGQTFTFRGDDDIWVFINDSLVVDNGGLHLPAPGYVQLDNLNLEPNNTYPIDIFFCDRQPTSSNVFIKTSMYFKQRKGIFYEIQGNTYDISKLEGGTGNCAALQNPGDANQIIDGAELELTYKLMDNRGNLIDIAGISPGGILPEGQVSYGGIDLTVPGQVTIDQDAITGLGPGRYRLVITDGTASEFISIRVAGTLDIVDFLGEGVASGMITPRQDTALSGELIPVYIVNKADTDIDPTDAAYQASWDEGLMVYEDPEGTIPVTPGGFLQTGDDGIDTLFVTGSRTATTEDVVTLRMGRASKPMVFLLPELAFVDTLGSSNIYPDSASLPELGQGGYAVPTSVFIGGFRPTDFSACADLCNDTLVISADSGLVFWDAAGNETNVIVLTNGWAEFQVSADIDVTDASFSVTGPSPLMYAEWKGITLVVPPVPKVTNAVMYDDNGDGRGDHLIAMYDRDITGEDMPDSIRIFWPRELDRKSGDDTAGVFISSATLQAALAAGGDLVDDGSGTLQVSMPDTGTIHVVRTTGFTTRVATGVFGQILTHSTFDLDSGEEVEFTDNRRIQDGIGPQIERARIYLGNGFDTVMVFMTEPVDYSSVPPENRKTMFEFILMGEGAIQEVVPTFVDAAARGLGDTLVLIFDTEAQFSPNAGDSIRIRVGDGLLRDTLGNAPSVNAPWDIIEGDKRQEVEAYEKPWTFDPADPFFVARAEEGPVSTRLITQMFADLDDIIQDSVFTQGHLIKYDMAEIYDKYNTGAGRDILGLSEGEQLDPGNVIMSIKNWYFTNQGTYVASDEVTVACNDKIIFNGDCRTNRGYLFRAWNLVDDSKRFVGSGVYLAPIQVSVSVEYNGVIIMEQKASDPEMFVWGIRRQTGRNQYMIANPPD